MRKTLLILAAAGLGAVRAQAADVSVRIHGEGWSDMGSIAHVTDTLVNNLNGNWQQSAGAQFTATASMGDFWDGAFGFGGYQVYSSLGKPEFSRTARFALLNFITESRMTYSYGGRKSPLFTLTFGNFPFIYNHDVKNLGAYLLRGPVYPGFLMSGFKDFRLDSTKGNVLGVRTGQALGNFRHDLILANEREVPPTSDWSVAYVAKYRALNALEVGAGANFYRLLANNPDLTTPSSQFYGYQDSAFIHDGKPHHPYDFEYIEVDTATGDTVFYTHRGIKLMGMFSLDLKPLFGGLSTLGPQDLKLYGEAAILGVQDYGSVYADIKQRIPWMTGINLPAFGLLDFLSVEVEWYGARYRNDLSKLGNFNTLGGGIIPFKPKNPAPIPSPVPVSYLNFSAIDANGNIVTPKGDTMNVRGTAMDYQNLTEDNWKWSVYLEKNVLDHIRFIGQVANDHYRPRPVAGIIQETGGMAEAFSSLDDWYWMFRVGYYF